MENGSQLPPNEGRDPSGFLSQIIGNPVTVKLNSGVVYKGESRRRRRRKGKPSPFKPAHRHHALSSFSLSLSPSHDSSSVARTDGQTEHLLTYFLTHTRPKQTGELQSVDGYMNIALEKTEEYVNGQKRRTYGDAFVRGNNGKPAQMNEPKTLRAFV